MFLNIDKKDPNTLAVIDDSGERLTYGDLCDKAKEFSEALPYRTLIFILAENCNGALLGYISALSNVLFRLLFPIIRSNLCLIRFMGSINRNFFGFQLIK